MLFTPGTRLWYEPGDACPECLGIMGVAQESCYCSATSRPPCSACENSWLECDDCGWKPEEEENNLLENMMKKIVEVKFRGKDGYSEKSYAYLTDIEDLKIGDWVLVVVNDEPVAVVVTEIMPSESSRAKANKWVAFKIDLAEYNQKVERQQLITEIEQELDEQVKKVQRYEVFKACAKTSPKMQELLAKLGELDPSINLIEMEKGE